MRGFFKVLSVEEFQERLQSFSPLEAEEAGLSDAADRYLSRDLDSVEDLPPLPRSSMDGYAVRAADTFGSSEGGPSYIECRGDIDIQTPPDFTLAPGECAAIVTGGCLPEGADAVVMVEHTGNLGGEGLGTIEIRRSVAPGENVMLRGEDAAAGKPVFKAGRKLRIQELGMLAALGITPVPVRKRPKVGIISTGDELVPVEATPRPGQIRDVNSVTLAGLAARFGARPRQYGYVKDEEAALKGALEKALVQNDVVMLSGGSSVGVRDLTLSVVMGLEDSEVLAHGVAVSPGKPCILARVGEKAVWGLPGQVASAFVVMAVFGGPFLRWLAGDPLAFEEAMVRYVPATLERNIASKHGRDDYVRVRLEAGGKDGLAKAVPVLGKSGLLKTLLQAEGLVRIPAEREGFSAGTRVIVRLFEDM